MENIFELKPLLVCITVTNKKIKIKKNPYFRSIPSWNSIIKIRNVLLTCIKICLYTRRHFQFQNKMNKVKPLSRNRLIFELANEIAKNPQTLQNFFFFFKYKSSLQ